jgi:hypothetical protein
MQFTKMNAYAPNVIRIKSDQCHIYHNILRLWASNDIALAKPNPRPRIIYHEGINRDWRTLCMSCYSLMEREGEKASKAEQE